MIKEKKETLYSLVCDNCGRPFEGPDYEWYLDEDELLDDAQEADWCGLYKAERNQKDDDDYLSDAEEHFCSLACREEYLEKKATSAHAPHFRESETRQISKS